MLSPDDGDGDAGPRSTSLGSKKYLSSPNNSNISGSGNKPPIKLSILEKDESEVSYLWKGCQLFSYIIIVLSGLSTSLAIASTVSTFKNECILYSNLSISILNPTIFINTNNMDNGNNAANGMDSMSGGGSSFQSDNPSPAPSPPSSSINVTIGTSNTWGEMSLCNFLQYYPVSSVIFSAIWATLFMMCGRGGNSSSNLPKPWRIVPPALLFNLIFVILSSCAVGYTFGGFNTFCINMIHNLNAAAGGAKLISNCDELEDFSWADNEHSPTTKTMQTFYNKVLIAESGAVIGLLGWLLGSIILLIRCATHADFIVSSSSNPEYKRASNCSETTLLDNNTTKTTNLLNTESELGSPTSTSTTLNSPGASESQMG